VLWPALKGVIAVFATGDQLTGVVERLRVSRMCATQTHHAAITVLDSDCTYRSWTPEDRHIDATITLI